MAQTRSWADRFIVLFFRSLARARSKPRRPARTFVDLFLPQKSNQETGKSCSECVALLFRWPFSASPPHFRPMLLARGDRPSTRMPITRWRGEGLRALVRMVDENAEGRWP